MVTINAFQLDGQSGLEGMTVVAALQPQDIQLLQAQIEQQQNQQQQQQQQQQLLQQQQQQQQQSLEIKDESEEKGEQHGMSVTLIKTGDYS